MRALQFNKQALAMILDRGNSVGLDIAADSLFIGVWGNLYDYHAMTCILSEVLGLPVDNLTLIANVQLVTADETDLEGETLYYWNI